MTYPLPTQKRQHGNALTERVFYRNGPDYRCGQSVGFREVKRDFGLYSVRVGSWVTKQEQSAAANQFHDALNDLMRILGGTTTLISLRGTLSMHYGTGGQRGVAAHYTPAHRTLALAKNAGPGSIAHEWFHALDHYLANKVFPRAAEGQFASMAWLKDAEPISHPLAVALVDCFRTILLDANGEETSAMFKASAAADRALGVVYYSRPEELAARAFEAFVQDASLTNHFLVKGTKASPEAKEGLYPEGEQRLAINRAFSRYFQMLGQALQTR